jgi:hypothetical protein
VALLTTANGRQAVLGLATEYEATDARTEYVAFSGRISARIQNLAIPIAGKFKIDIILGGVLGADPCENHAERKIGNAAQNDTILSISASRPICQSCQAALWYKVDCLVPLGSRTCGYVPSWIPPLPN